MDSPSIPEGAADSPVTQKMIFLAWWPLAVSWLLMALELPALSAVVARLPAPETNLAAYGGIVFPLALIIESPVIMLLAASTALSKDWQSYKTLRRYMMTMGAVLTGLHIFIAFTPLYDVVVLQIMGAPQEIIEPARIGLRLMTPWTWSIAYRRFNQGVLIRFGHSQTVGVGTLVRLASDGLVLTIGYLSGEVAGIVVATAAVSTGVISEALYVGFRTRSILPKVRATQPVKEPVQLGSFLDFYIPLAMTSLLTLLVQPLGSATLSRMPNPIASLAVWPVVSGLIFMIRSVGMAYNEVVVALTDQPDAYRQLRRFTLLLVTVTSAVMLLIIATPLSEFWFSSVAALKPELSALAQQAIWLALPMPALNVIHSWFQGILLNSRKTRGISEAVAIFLLVSGLTLWGGVIWSGVTGIFIGLLAFNLGAAAQALWLWVRSRGPLEALRERSPTLKGIAGIQIPAP